jgi:hypothetical protein
MKRPALGIIFAAALSVFACPAFAQNSPPEPPPKAPPFPTPQKAPSPESPQNTTNASAQAEADYKAARAKCDMGSRDQREKCVSDAEEQFYGALAGTNPGEQGNPGSRATETGK